MRLVDSGLAVFYLQSCTTYHGYYRNEITYVVLLGVVMAMELLFSLS